jgi:mannose-1-phosphate guanylyltransferase
MRSPAAQRVGHRWAVVLAGGEGSRLQALTGEPGQRPIPKQFCSLHGGPSLLRLALERARRSVPGERVVVVVARRHRRWFEGELAALPRGNVVVQPANRGTAAGLLLPLLSILRRDAHAELVVLAADHWVDAEWTLQAAIEQGFAALPRSRAVAILLGMTPEGAEADLGWILPRRGPHDDWAVRGVRCFREKPPAAEAAAMQQRGALVNSFLLVARGRRLLRLYMRQQPELTTAMRGLTAAGAPLTAGRYRRLPMLDVSRDLLEPAAGALAVVRVPPCGWSDLGTPERVHRCLAGQRRRTTGAPPAPAPAWPPAGAPCVLAQRLAPA